MKLPELPEPGAIDGNRIMYTKVQMRAYGKLCFEAGEAVDEEFIPPVNTSVDPKVDDLLNIFGIKL